ncbi:hypothetical protein L596_019723 [Steinernema carpocapsae]|nr:hypothetical protein L596_019723 [Steinernema carpocapsae]
MECTGTNDAKETYFSWDKDFFKSNDETPVIVKRTAKCDGLGNWIVQDKTRTFGAKDVACISSSKSTPKCAKCKIWEEKKTVFDDFQPIGITKADKTKDGCIQQRISCKPKSHKEFGIFQWEFAKISKGDNAGEELSTILTCDENEKWTLPLGLKNQNDPEVNEAQCTSKLAKHIEKEQILRLPGAAKEEIVCKRDCGTIGKIGEKNVVENWGDPTCLTAEITCNVGDSKPVTLQFEERDIVLATLQGNGETKVMVKCGENNGKWVYTDPDNNDFEFNDVTCSETVN